MSWFERIVPSRIKTERRTRSVPEGLWTKCPACDAVLYRAEIERNLHVCPKCSHHMRIDGRERLMKFLDTGSTAELAAKVEPEDPLKFKDSKRYKDRLVQAQKQTGERDALVVLTGKLAGLDVVACAFEFRFLGGSMGSVVGEKFVRAVEHCLEHRMPLICFAASGGARMQESILSLMQMAKTSAALARLHKESVPFISLLADPTTGISTGITVTLSSATQVVDGAFWMIAARPATPQGVYPEDLLTVPQPPDGPRRWVCPLAVIDWSGAAGPSVSDCRSVFDGLVALTKRKPGCCTVGIVPGDVTSTASLQNLLDSAAARAVSVTVCLSAGEYALSAPLRLDGRHARMTATAKSSITLRAGSRRSPRATFGSILT